MNYFGRKKLYTNEQRITDKNVLDILAKAFSIHLMNQADIEYLYGYYKGNQPILARVKDVRPEINNKIVENRANEIVSFKVGYLMGEPIQYVSREDDEEVSRRINTLNEYMISEEKAPKDKDLSEWSHICGTSYRMVLPNKTWTADSGDAPFRIYTLDPRFTFVVYYNGLGEPPIMAVTFNKRDEGIVFSVYTETDYYEILDLTKIEKHTVQYFGIPIIEYPANNARLGAFEIVLPLLDAINTVDSNLCDNVEQIVQALMLFHNVDISSDDFDALRARGALKYNDVDPNTKGEIKYLINELQQSQTQSLVERLYQTVLTISGMPNRNGGTSTSDTGSAVVLRDGWSAAEARAKDSELTFKRSERPFLKLIIRICRIIGHLDIKFSAIDIRFTRRNYENITQKANVLVEMLNNKKIAPQLAFRHCGLFVDPESAYLMSEKYAKEQEEKELAELKKIGGAA